MTNFWYIAGSMLVLALGFVLLPLLRRQKIDNVDLEAAELEVYRQKLQDLREDIKRGTLSEEQFLKSQQELEVAAAREFQAHSGQVPGLKNRRHWLAALLVITAIPGLATWLYTKIGAHDQVILALQEEQESKEKVETMKQQLTSLINKLKDNPNDGEGWWLLGRSMLALGQYDKAIEALEKAKNILGDDPELTLDYAQALVSKQGDKIDNSPAELIEGALAKAPESPRALWMAALVAMQKSDQATAKTRLEKLQTLVEPGSPQAKLVDNALKSLTSPAIAAPTEDAGSNASAGSVVKIDVQVALDPKFKDQVSPDTTVFVYAKAAEGPPMPLAATRKQVKDLPLTVTLDDTMAMMPEMRLSKFPQIIVGARISKNGTPMPASGDIEGSVANPLTLSEIKGPIAVLIDRVVP